MNCYVNQIGLITAGSQPYGHDLCLTTNGTRFAYCATLATYIYELDKKYTNEYTLASIVCNHSTLITSITWHPHNQDLIATCSTSNDIVIWNMDTQKQVFKIKNLNGTPTYLQWNPYEPSNILCVLNRRLCFAWNYEADVFARFKQDDSLTFNSNVIKFRFHTKTLKIAFAHVDGSISIVFLNAKKSKKHILRDESVDDDGVVSFDEEEQDLIQAIEWDVLSNDYLLVAYKLSGLRLLDAEKNVCICKYDLPSKAISVRTLAWIPDAPGLFLTGDYTSGILRLWNVSKQSPLENFQLKRKGFLSMSVLRVPSTQHSQISSFVSSERNFQNAIDDRVRFKKPLGACDYTVPEFKILASFADGGTGLYDFNAKNWNFFKEQGHLETIFDCKFNNFNNDIIATASFDGSIKIWSISKQEILDSTPLSPDDGIIYSCSWSPQNSNQIAASTSKNGCFIWDFSRKKLVHRFQQSNSSVYCIAWNKHDSKKIATASADGFCVIYQIDDSNKVTCLTRYKHPSKVYGCDWSPTQKEMIATACDDKKVRVYYLHAGDDQALKIFSGHTAKVFSVKWSPILDGIFCSSSDDCKILIWDYSCGTCIGALTGHLQPVRALAWNFEIPFLVISGSWDSTVKIWDTRCGECLETLHGHTGDIYGLTTHPSKPFIFASASRDSTIRIWDLSNLFNYLYLSVLVRRPWSDLMNVGALEYELKEKCLSRNARALLLGRYSKDLRLELEQCIQDSIWFETLKKFSNFFTSIDLTHLWSLVEICMNSREILIDSSYYKGIVHYKHITKTTTSASNELLLSLNSSSGILTSQKKIKSLENAADLCLKLGNLQKYCEIMIDLNEWERALAIAPGVSLKYWKQLIKKYIVHLKNENSTKFIPFSISIGEVEETLEHFIRHGLYRDALIVSAAYAEGSIEKLNINNEDKNEKNGQIDEEKLKYVKDVYLKYSERFIDHADPISAACCHLAVDDYQSAMRLLLRGNQIELVFCFSQFLSGCQEYFDISCLYLSRRAEAINRLDLSIDFLNLIQNSQLKETSKIELCCRFKSNDETARDNLYDKCDLPSFSECSRLAKRLNPKTDLNKYITFNILAKNFEISLDLAVIHFNFIVKSHLYSYDDLFQIVNLTSCICCLNEIDDQQRKSDLMCMSYYVGLLLAIRKSYYEIVGTLFDCLKNLLVKSSKISLDLRSIAEQQQIWLKYAKNNFSISHLNNKESQIFQDLLVKSQTNCNLVEFGSIITVGSKLPSNSNKIKSFISGKLIGGSAYMLEDGETMIELNEALMWSRVCAFSPLCTGSRNDCF